MRRRLLVFVLSLAAIAALYSVGTPTPETVYGQDKLNPNLAVWSDAPNRIIVHWGDLSTGDIEKYSEGFKSGEEYVFRWRATAAGDDAAFAYGNARGMGATTGDPDGLITLPVSDTSPGGVEYEVQVFTGKPEDIHLCMTGVVNVVQSKCGFVGSRKVHTNTSKTVGGGTKQAWSPTRAWEFFAGWLGPTTAEAAPLQQNTSILYATDVSSDSVYSVNATTGAFTLIGSTGVNAPVDLTYNCVNSTMYGLDVSSDLVYTVNLTNGVWTQIPGSTAHAGSASMTYNCDDSKMYGAEWHGTNSIPLRTINLSDGTWTAVSATGGETSTRAIGYNQSDDKMYAARGSRADVYSVVIATSAFTSLGTTGQGNIVGLGHEPSSNVMYAVTTNDELVTVNLTNGSATVVGSTGTSEPFGIAAFPSSNNAPTVSVAASKTTVAGSEQITVTATGNDADGDALTYNWTQTGVSGTFTATNIAQVLWTSPVATTSNQTSTLTVTVNDGNGGTANASVVITTSGVSVPGVPSNLMLVPGTNYIDASWDAPSNTGGGITDYDVEFKISTVTTWTDWTTHSGTGTSTRITGLITGTGYDVRVAAINAAGTGPFVGPLSVNTTTAGSFVPDDINPDGLLELDFAAVITSGGNVGNAGDTNLYATGGWTPNAGTISNGDLAFGTGTGTFERIRTASSDRLRLNGPNSGSTADLNTVFGTGGERSSGNGWSFYLMWDSNIGRVQLSVDSVSSANAMLVNEPTGSQLTSWQSITAGNQFIFALARSNPKPGKADPPTVVPGNAALRVTWNAPSHIGSSAITGYGVRYRQQGDVNWIDLPHTGTTAVFDIAPPAITLTNGQTYEVQVQARNASGNGLWSDAASGTPTAAAPTPVPPSDATGSISTGAPISGVLHELVITTGSAHGNTGFILDTIGSVLPTTFDAFGLTYEIIRLDQNDSTGTMRLSVTPCVTNWQIQEISLTPAARNTTTLGNDGWEKTALLLSSAICSEETRATTWTIEGVNEDRFNGRGIPLNAIQASDVTIAVSIRAESPFITSGGYDVDYADGAYVTGAHRRDGIKETICSLPDSFIGEGACPPIMMFVTPLTVAAVMLMLQVKNPAIISAGAITGMSAMGIIVLPGPIMILGLIISALGMGIAVAMFRR